MSAFVGEIRPFAFDQIPKGWMRCEGQLMLIMHNQALFSLLSTTYGGNGTTDFALPDLRGRVAVGAGTVQGGPSVVLGEKLGEERHVLTQSEMPQHSHQVSASSADATEASPANNVWAKTDANRYGSATKTLPMNPASLAPAGGSQAHENRQPYLALCFCIATQGIYPSRP